MANLLKKVKKAWNWLIGAKDKDAFEQLTTLKLGLASEIHNNIDDAIAHYELAVVENPKNAYAHGMLGSHYAEKREYARAIEHYKKALDCIVENDEINWLLLPIAPSSAGNLFSCAIAQADQTANPRILEELLEKNYARFSPEGEGLVALAHFKIGTIYFNRNEYTKACEHLIKWQQSRQEYLQVLENPEEDHLLDQGWVSHGHKFLGACYLHNREPDKAIAELHKALETATPEERPALVHEVLGMCYELKGDYQRAMIERLKSEGLA